MDPIETSIEASFEDISSGATFAVVNDVLEPTRRVTGKVYWVMSKLQNGRH